MKLGNHTHSQLIQDMSHKIIIITPLVLLKHRSSNLVSGSLLHQGQCNTIIIGNTRVGATVGIWFTHGVLATLDVHLMGYHGTPISRIGRHTSDIFKHISRICTLISLTLEYFKSGILKLEAPRPHIENIEIFTNHYFSSWREQITLRNQTAILARAAKPNTKSAMISMKAIPR